MNQTTTQQQSSAGGFLSKKPARMHVAGRTSGTQSEGAHNDDDDARTHKRVDGRKLLLGAGLLTVIVLYLRSSHPLLEESGPALIAFLLLAMLGTTSSTQNQQ
ncbi:hypothetical protein [Flaviaesturariibacter amylovorans]|uniref:Uncharacterized protein n=1 Tax=Flaviaesturariibacter amylovorans TaxID=1084520 RepID=A0ABP8HS68_9BACT